MAHFRIFSGIYLIIGYALYLVLMLLIAVICYRYSLAILPYMIYKVFDKRVFIGLFSFKNRTIELEQNKIFCNYCFLAPIYRYAQFYPDIRGTVDMTVHQ